MFMSLGLCCLSRINLHSSCVRSVTGAGRMQHSAQAPAFMHPQHAMTGWGFKCGMHGQVGAEDVVVATKNGTSIGVAFVEFRRYQDGERILALDRKYFGARYVEVNMSTLEEQLRLTGSV